MWKISSIRSNQYYKRFQLYCLHWLNVDRVFRINRFYVYKSRSYLDFQKTQEKKLSVCVVNKCRLTYFSFLVPPLCTRNFIFALPILKSSSNTCVCATGSAACTVATLREEFSHSILQITKRKFVTLLYGRRLQQGSFYPLFGYNTE